MKRENIVRKSTKKPAWQDERLFKGLFAFIEAEHEMTRDAIGRRLETIELALDLVVREVWPDLKIGKVKAEKRKEAA